MPKFKNNQLLSIKFRSKRSLEEATESARYNYWLSHDDIADIARTVYQNYQAKDSSHSEFEIVGSLAQLEEQIKRFKSRYDEVNEQRFTIILNLSNLHWVTLVFNKHQGGCDAYYVDSKGNPLPDNYHKLLREQGIRLIYLQPIVQQQTDDYNCGLWALENAKDLNDMLDDKSKSLVRGDCTARAST